MYHKENNDSRSRGGCVSPGNCICSTCDKYEISEVAMDNLGIYKCIYNICKYISNISVCSYYFDTTFFIINILFQNAFLPILQILFYGK